jgi:hypothetical protein
MLKKRSNFLKLGKRKKKQKIMIKDLILPKSMLCVVKKYSMNGCEMSSSLFLGHFYFIKWYLKEKDQEKTKPNWINFGKKKNDKFSLFSFFTLHFKAVSSFPIASHVNDY